MNAPTPELQQRFSDWQRHLTSTSRDSQSPSEIAGRQQILISAVSAGIEAFTEYLRTELDLGEPGGIGPPPLPRRIDPSELRDPPLQLERELYSSFEGHTTPSEASQPLFWTRCHYQWIASGHFGDNLFGAFLGSLVNGAEEKTTEAATRNLLRRMGGLPHVRGKVSVLNDCPISRAWWRGRLAVLAAERSQGSFDVDTAHRVLHSSNDAWSRLVGHSVRRVTVINHSSVRAALIEQYRNASRDSGGIPAAEFQTVIRLLARHGPALIFDALSASELSELTAQAIADARSGNDDDLPSAPATPVQPTRPATLTLPLTRFLRR